jgi:L-seryl-tRNA(Ser) seleniumtransferase
MAIAQEMMFAMQVSDQQHQQLRQLPGVDLLLAEAMQQAQCRRLPKAVVLRAIRETLEAVRNAILADPEGITVPDLSNAAMLDQAVQRALAIEAFNLKRVINATGVVVHTNLGRSCLAPEAIAHMSAVAAHYSNLEFDLSHGRRGSRYSAVEEILCELSGAEAAMVVNNNAAAVLLCLDTLAKGRQVIISRGELVEIGGSFRIPDVMAKSGALLKEVGTTNRTHLRDYEQAIGARTALLMKVHTSNYQVIGFTASVGLAELVALGNRFNLPVMEDLGSGNLVDLANHGLLSEPTVQASVKAGAHVVTFSGDKLLGGPQAGLILGRKSILERIKRNPLTRALRIDKLTLAALEATLHLYRDPIQANQRIPTLRMLLTQKPEIERRAHELQKRLEQLNVPGLGVQLIPLSSKAGGGSLPLLELPSCCVAVEIKGISANALEKRLRLGAPPIIGRIVDDRYLIDLRTVMEDELELIAGAIQTAADQQTTGDDV